MLHLRRPAYGGARLPRDCDTLTLLRRSEPVRVCLMTLAAWVAGAWISLLFLPVSSVEGLVTAHLAGAGEPVGFWLALCRARLPFWLLTALAGLTRFSGGLTSGVLVWRGLCDGAVLAQLGSAAVRGVDLPLPEGLSAGWFLWAVAVWCVLDTVIRLLQTIAARKMARVELKAPTSDGRMDPALRGMLLRYAVISLGLLCADACVCAGYAAVMWRVWAW